MMIKRLHENESCRRSVFFVPYLLIFRGRGLIGYVGVLVGVLLKCFMTADEADQKGTDDDYPEYLKYRDDDRIFVRFQKSIQFFDEFFDLIFHKTCVLCPLRVKFCGLRL